MKLLEQRHCDIVKEMTEHHASEKEILAHHNNVFEEKIQCLEAEEARLRNDLLLAQKFSLTVEKENQTLTSQVLMFYFLFQVYCQMYGIFLHFATPYKLNNSQNAKNR